VTGGQHQSVAFEIKSAGGLGASWEHLN